MIKIAILERILLTNGDEDVYRGAVNIFRLALKNSGMPFVKKFTDMGLSDAVYTKYYKAGYAVLEDTLMKKKIDITAIPAEYVIDTGLLDNEAVIGQDLVKGGQTALYTRNTKILRMLYNAGAFEDGEAFEKNMLALEKKVATCFEKNGLAMGRLDIVKVFGDEVELKLTIPTKPRTDYTDTFLMYPYSSFFMLASDLVTYVNRKGVGAISVQQRKVGEGVKERKLTFNPEIVKKAYSKCPITLDDVEEFKSLLENKIKKGKPMWDVLKLQLRGYNLESSLYSVAYTTIRLENLISISLCRPKDLDMSQALIDYDDLHNLFKTKVNSWRSSDFAKFTVVDTSTCANNEDRKKMLFGWIPTVENKTLYTIMSTHPELFGDVKEGLLLKYRLKPRAEKTMHIVNLPANPQERLKVVKDYLARGICKIEVQTVKGTNRVYMCTTNESVLQAKLGANYAIKFESVKQKLHRLEKEVTSGKLDTCNKFADRLIKADLGGIVDYSGLTANSIASDFLKVLQDAEAGLKAKAHSDNEYLVNFKRTTATTVDDFYGSADVRCIESFEFGAVN